MLHVLFVILKIIGILLAVILALIILVLAVPIRYSFHLEKEENASPVAQIKVAWFGFILSFKASYIDKTFDYRLRIFGHQMLGNQEGFLNKKKEKEKRKEDKKRKKEAEERKKEEASSVEKSNEKLSKERKDSDRRRRTSSSEKSNEEFSKTKGHSEKTRKKTSAKKKPPQIREKISSIIQKIKDFRETYAEYNGTEVLLFFKECIIKIMRHVLPRKLQGFVRFGFDDPSTTGMLTGAAAIFYPKYERYFSLEPEFQEACFAASCKGRGRIHLGYFLYMGIHILLNADVRRLIKKLLG